MFFKPETTLKVTLKIIQLCSVILNKVLNTIGKERNELDKKVDDLVDKLSDKIEDAYEKYLLIEAAAEDKKEKFITKANKRHMVLEATEINTKKALEKFTPKD